jgi:hypothetical protein
MQQVQDLNLQVQHKDKIIQDQETLLQNFKTALLQKQEKQAAAEKEASYLEQQLMETENKVKQLEMSMLVLKEAIADKDDKSIHDIAALKGKCIQHIIQILNQLPGNIEETFDQYEDAFASLQKRVLKMNNDLTTLLTSKESQQPQEHTSKEPEREVESKPNEEAENKLNGMDIGLQTDVEEATEKTSHKELEAAVKDLQSSLDITDQKLAIQLQTESALRKQVCLILAIFNLYCRYLRWVLQLKSKRRRYPL